MRSKKIIHYCLLCLPFFAQGFSGLRASPVVILNNEDASYLLGRDMELLKDTNLEYPDLKDVLQESVSKKFRPSVQKIPNFGFTRSRVWARVKVKNVHPHLKEWLFVLDNPITDEIHLYFPDKRGRYQKIELGDLRPFQDYIYKTDSHLALLELPRNEVVTLYFSVRSESTLIVSARMESERAYINRFAHSRLLQGFFIGILVVMFVYNISLYFSIRDISYVYYVLYIFFFLIASMALYGTGYQYLWPGQVWWNQRAFLVCIASAVLFGLLFSSHFLGIVGNFPRIMKGIYVYLACLLAIILSAFHFSHSELMPIMNLLAFAFPPFILAFAIYRLWQGYRPAIFFISAFASVIFATVVFALRGRGLLPDTFFTNHSLQIGSTIEIILFSLGLSARIHALRIEKEEARKEALKKQRELSESYARFVPPQVLTILNKSSITEVELGDAIEKRMSILFADIRSFTNLSETMSPTDNYKFLSSIFKSFGPAIRSRHGYIDKYIGDAILALFPGTAEDAVCAAIEMQQTIYSYNERRVAKGKRPLRLGIGINTGKLMLGTLGDEERLEATVISDAVNLASRMEGLTKQYHAGLIISEHTLVALNDPNKFRFRFLDQVAVRGKRDKVSLYEVLDADKMEERKLKIQTLELFEHGVHEFYMDNYEEAIRKMEEVRKMNPADAVASLYIKRAKRLLKKAGSIHA